MMSEPREKFQTGLELQRAGDLIGAALRYEEVIQDQPDFTDAINNLVTVRNELGDQLLNGGQIEEALLNYRRALELASNNAGTFNNIGRALLATGKIEEAIGNFNDALKLDPVNPNYHFNLALALSGLGEFEQSIGHFKKTARDRKDWPNAHFGLATSLSRIGRHDEAILSFRKGLALQPDHPELEKEYAASLIAVGEREEPAAILGRILVAHPEDQQAHFLVANLARLAGQYEKAVIHNGASMDRGGDTLANSINMANCLISLGRCDEAVSLLADADRIAPESPELWITLGNAYLQAGKTADAVTACRRSLDLAPGSAMAANNLVLALLKAGEPDQAATLATQNTQNFPGDAATWSAQGAVCLSTEEFEEALVAFDKSLELTPGDISVMHNRGTTLHRLGQYEDALQVYQKIVTEAPDSARSWFNLGNILQVLSRHEEAIDAFRCLLKIDPENAAALSLLAHSLHQECLWGELPSIRARVIELTRAEINAGSIISTSPFSLLQLSAPGDVRLASARQSARAAENLSKNRHEKMPPIWSTQENEKLRIGYISPDFRNHSAGRAFLALLKEHDREKFSFFGYSTSSDQDDVTNDFRRNFQSFVQLDDLPFAEAARRINADGINILIDLAGHTRGSRLEILAERPAPVQAHFMGYGHTIGADYVDWLITDEIRTPASELDYCHENIVYLPHTILPVHAPEISSVVQASGGIVDRISQGLPEEAVVFANFNGHYKFGAEIFAAWMQILQQTPGSVLWLMKFDGGSVNNLRHAARQAGTDPDRLIFADKCSNSDHLARLALADLALDTRHHAGGVTTTDALWAGLPVLTLLEDGMVDRMGASLLTAAGLPELIATSLPDYVDRATGWGTDGAALAHLKEKLAAARTSAPLLLTRTFYIIGGYDRTTKLLSGSACPS